ncbi:hypothetical protein WR25_02577 [Diploscapter pachys]|uniref:Carbohydrate kinase PfkB domain-containing protein n=1 Tax=Diploscapter pachys TaxID=2018661 RepID=A0A2A2LA53_9BILA|nr:hypothetical protein WR25_02577 [Diploscapter pachys]
MQQPRFSSTLFQTGHVSFAFQIVVYNVQEEKSIFHDKTNLTSSLITVSKCESNSTCANAILDVNGKIIATSRMSSGTNDGGSYAGKMEQRCGGVARNHADALTRLGCDVTFLSAIGSDALGEWVRKRCNHMNWDNVVVSNKFSTATYLSINVQGNINFGINSIGNVIYDISPEYIKKNEQSIAEADFVLMDGNISEEAIKQIAITSKYYNKKIWFEPTDYHKVNKIMDDDVLPQISIMSPNANEFMYFAQKCDVSVNPTIFTSPYHVGEFVLSNLKLLHSFDYLIVSLAQNGTAIIRKADDGSYSFIGLPPPIQPDLIVSASGAGDSFNSGFLAAMLNGVPFDASPIVGQKCASLTLQTIEAVSTQITPKLISEIRSYSKKSPA